ncbi:pentatricopeptide repeat-containing protein At3g24000, mitochondrial [Musa acuminata AAA Group]|uniref:pentatricopeptide repeat-containing protein At3g24000, mitochondrial n=1 Tax=Musa acuminata AAA Group TaxID=214697 RepID=UPI0031CF9C7B
MKKLLSPLNSISAALVSRPILLRFVSSHFTTAAAFLVDDSADSSEPEAGRLRFPSVIRDKDLLLKSPTAESGLLVLDLIDAGSLEPSADLYADLVKRCTQFKKLKEGRLVHAHLMRSEFKSDIFLQNSIVNLYCKCGSLDDARKAFDEMPARDMVTWTALITGYAQNDRPNEAVEMLPRMLRLRLVPNAFTFGSLFKACGAASRNGHCEEVHALSVKCGCSPDVYVGSAILDMYARHGRMEEACLVFDQLDSKNEVSWNALIAGYARREDCKTAMKMFWEMQRSGFEATHFTYSSIFSACASIGALEQGKWVHAQMIKCGQVLTAFVGNTLLDMYAKSGSIRDARKIFDRVNKKDLVSWNSMLTAYAQHGIVSEAIHWFEEMRKLGVQPNQITFLCILTACSHGGLLKEGQYYFDMMKRYKVEPEIEHYVTIVDLLGRAGLLDRAQKFINEMPVQPSAAVWGALLGACRMHKNAELGKFAAERVFELDPYDAGPHVLLYNIYASTGRWTDAAKVRKMMKDGGVKKEPACSWVEMENSVHMFVANDDSHPQIKEIHKMWEKIDAMIKEAGYVPDTNYVLLYVDEHEREAKLQYHSEKLALAFALLKMPLGAPIRIMKNIRMCGDCHSAIKHVSKVMEREIIVRDTNRFHHFSGGSCSCGDYW